MSIVHIYLIIEPFIYFSIHFLIWAVSVLHTRHMQIVRTVQSRATRSLLVSDFILS